MLWRVLSTIRGAGSTPSGAHADASKLMSLRMKLQSPCSSSLVGGRAASAATLDLDPKLRLAVQLVLAVSVVKSLRRLVAIAGEALVALALGAARA